MTRLYRQTRVVALHLIEHGAERHDTELRAGEVARATRLPRQTAYGILDRFADAGWLTWEWQESPAGMPGPPARVFHPTASTPAGLAALLGMTD